MQTQSVGGPRAKEEIDHMPYQARVPEEQRDQETPKPPGKIRPTCGASRAKIRTHPNTTGDRGSANYAVPENKTNPDN